MLQQYNFAALNKKYMKKKLPVLSAIAMLALSATAQNTHTNVANKDSFPQLNIQRDTINRFIKQAGTALNIQKDTVTARKNLPDVTVVGLGSKSDYQQMPEIVTFTQVKKMH